MIMMSRFTIVQAALMLLSLFFGLFFQDFARPYESLTADHVEFGSLLISHFILLLGILFHSVQLEQIKWNEGTCLEVMTDISNAQNLSTVINEWDDIAVACAEEKITFAAANDTYNSIVVMLKWFPVLFLILAVWASYTDLYKALHIYLRQFDDDDVEPDDPKLAKLHELCAGVLAPNVLPGAKDFLRDSTPTEREYFKHLLMLLDENYQDWLDRQAKTMGEFIRTTASRLISNIEQLYKIMVAFFQILFCLKQRKRSHIEEDPHAAGGVCAVSGSSEAAAVALPHKGAKRQAVITKVSGVVKAKLKIDTDVDPNAKALKQKRLALDPNADVRIKAADVDQGEDMVEAYIKFAKSKSAADRGTDGNKDMDTAGKDGSERLAFPELRPART